MSMLDWAKREVDIACEREREASGNKEEEFGYGCACYESALKAYKSLCKDGHSGMSIAITKHILVRLIEGKPLTPIEDVPEVWSDLRKYGDNDGHMQCLRMSSLFKDVDEHGNIIKYSDVNRVVCEDVNTGSTWRNGFVSNIVDELFPITMPYMPDNNSYIVYMEEFLFDEKNGDWDTMGILEIKKPNGEKIWIGRYFKEDPNGHSFIEIDIDEYNYRRVIGMKEDSEDGNSEEVR